MAMYNRSYGLRSPREVSRTPDLRAYQSVPQMSLSNSATQRFIELARPSEPRRLSHSWNSPAAPREIPKRIELISATSYQAETLHQTAQLPGVRDILSPGPHPPVPNLFPPAWPSTIGPALRPQYRSASSENYFAPRQQQYPFPMQSYAGEPLAHKSYQGRSLQLPVLNTKPEPGPGPPSQPETPFIGHSESFKDYIDARPYADPRPSCNRWSGERPHTPYSPTGSISPQDHRSSSGLYGLQPGRTSINGPSALAHYLGVRDIPGKGMCHVYDNGHSTSEYIDGEWVNPHWGITKANKPRKRLAQACLDCREKKIKCEPGENSCIQCDKAKRTCRRAFGPPTPGETIPGAPWSATSPIRNRLSDPTPTATTERISDPARKRGRSPESNGFSGFDSNPDESSDRPNKVRSESPTGEPGSKFGHEAPAHVEAIFKPAPSADYSAFSWEDDPYEIDPNTTRHLLRLYFMHVNSATYRMFPEVAFVHWVENYPQKFQNERMLLYAVLAMGSVFADDSLSAVAKQCADIATNAVEREHGRFSMQLAQARLLLSIYNFAKGRNTSAWDHCGSAVRVISHLRFNTEEGCTKYPDHGPDHRREFAFNRGQLIECQRRTFWTAFVMDRYNGFCGGMSCTIHPDDIFLRLPCSDLAFEEGVMSVAPYFNNEVIDPDLSILTPTSEIAPMAWLVIVSGMWGEVLSFINRSKYHRSPVSYREAYEKFYADIHTRIIDWLSRLPHALKYNVANTDRSIQEGYAGTYISMHALYHFTLMKLNRCLRHQLMPIECVRRNIRAANEHAHEVLRIMSTLRNARREVSNVPQGQNSMFELSTPFPGYVSLQAIDILGAGGLNTELDPTLRDVDGGIACLEELTGFWTSARSQLKAAEQRRRLISTILENPIGTRAGCQLGRNWGLEAPIDREFGLDADCVYGVDQKLYFGALAEGSTDSADEVGKV